MSPQISRDEVWCEKCANPIVLPHQSPLGIFQGLRDQPTDEWPANFLCPLCGHRFVCSVDMIQTSAPVPVPDSLIPDLLRVECICDHKNTATKKVVYTTCPRGRDPKGEVERLMRRLVDMHTILRMDAYPYGERAQ
jgi:hypothetical protein